MTIREYNIVDETGHLDLSSLKPNNPKWIILHSTSKRESFESVNRLHKSYGWAGVGYHYFIDHKGVLSQTRPVNVEGAHALGFNFCSIGVCVYSPNEHLDDERLEEVEWLMRQIIGQKKLDIIPHTLAQILFFNRLLIERDIGIAIEGDDEVCRDGTFQMLESKVRGLALNLKEKYPGVSKELGYFKRCPHGDIYYQVRKKIKGY